jgi:hypothetical protein
MAYNQQNLIKLTGAPFAGAWNMWLYRSADTYATVKAANFISNAFDMGVKVRDLIVIVDTATPATTLANVLTCTSAPACTISQTGVVVAE